MSINYSDLKQVFNLDSLEKLSVHHLSAIRNSGLLTRQTLRFLPIDNHLQVVDITICREPSKEWQVKRLTTFDVEQSKEVYFYFHFAYGWFFHADIGAIDLIRPEVCRLFHSWLRAFVCHLKNGQYNPPLLIHELSGDSTDSIQKNFRHISSIGIDHY
ncbi:DUF2787 family protein [Vibrio vulnificus]|nr:DUF2787 family protein [Vibrio vulnificus]